MQDSRLGHGYHEKIFGFFLCFNSVSFVGDHSECKGDVAFPPTCGPPRRQGLGIQF